MKLNFIACLALGVILSSCGKTKSEVTILQNGVPITGSQIVLQISRLNGDTGVKRYSATSDTHGVAHFDATPDGDSIYHILLVESDGEEKTIASGGQGEFGSVGDWREKGYSVKLREH